MEGIPLAIIIDIDSVAINNETIGLELCGENCF